MTEHVASTAWPPCHTGAEYLENLARKMFISGFAKGPVAARWPHFRHVFYGFDLAMVAEMPEPLVEELGRDPGLIRNRRKIAAIVANAGEMLRLVATHGSVYDYLRSMDDLSFEARLRDISQRFRGVGPNTAYYFLLDAGEPVPPQKPAGVK